MDISAAVVSKLGEHQVTVSTGGQSQSLQIAPKAEGFGSSVNGGELLCLALATCYCNDLYREAKKTGIELDSVEVQVSSRFGAAGEPGRDIQYRASVSGKASEAELQALMRNTDRVAEIQNTLRQSSTVVLSELIGRDSRT